MNKYEEVLNRHMERVKNFPLGVASNDRQFKDMMEKWGLSKYDIDKIVPIGEEGFVRKIDLEDYNKMCYEIRKEPKDLIEQDKTGEGYIKDMFVSELERHKYCITYELDDTLGLSYEQVVNSPSLTHGLILAKKEILDKENMRDYDIE